MNVWDVLIPLAALLVGIVLMAAMNRRRRVAEEPEPRGPKILFPFIGAELSERALQSALRLARAEHAVVVPAYLATVPLPLTLEAPVGRACDDAFAVFEAIDRRAAAYGVPVDSRIVRGRTARHALRQLVAEVPTATRIVAAASTDGRHDGFSVDDIAWLLRNAPGEVVVLRPRPEAIQAARAVVSHRRPAAGPPAGLR